MALSLCQYSVDVKYKHVKLMIFTDALSRVPSPISTMVRMITKEEVKELFKEAHSIRQVHHG
jgi:hypothetical protein